MIGPSALVEVASKENRTGTWAVFRRSVILGTSHAAPFGCRQEASVARDVSLRRQPRFTHALSDVPHVAPQSSHHTAQDMGEPQLSRPCLLRKR